MRSIAVYCSASDGLPQLTQALARDLGRLCAERGIRIVYGGGARGLMGIVAQAAHQAGGSVRGYMLEALCGREGANVEIGELRVVSSLDERKRSYQIITLAADSTWSVGELSTPKRSPSPATNDNDG